RRVRGADAGAAPGAGGNGPPWTVTVRPAAPERPTRKDEDHVAMPYKREGSPYYYVRRRRLPGYGDTGRLSSKATSKAVARRMEQALEDVAQRALLDPSYVALLDAVCREKTLTLADLVLAKSQGRLDALRRSLHDPKLT